MPRLDLPHFIRVLALIGILTHLPAAKAADMALVQHQAGLVHQHMMLIEGEIREGDYKKFLKFFFDHPTVTTVHLASKGGSITESMKIGEALRSLYLKTAAPLVKGKSWIRLQSPSNSVCASSCFLIFVAGIERSGYVVGLHRPYLTPDDYKNMSLSESQNSFEVVKSKVGAYLAKMNVPGKYFDMMISARPEELRWLSTGEIQQDFSGYIPAVHEFMNAKCSRVTPEDERAFNGVFARIPPERKHMGMRDAVIDPKDKVLFAAYARKMEEEAACREDILDRERIKAMDQLLATTYKLLKGKPD